MSSKDRVLNSKENILMEYEVKHKVYCTNPKCHGIGVVFKHKEIEYKLCPNCMHYIFRDEKAKLKYEMKRRGIKSENKI